MQFFLFFFTGLFIGSFLNVCIYRIPREESIVFPPSHCPACGTNIKAIDLIPVISWLALKGRCRSCGARISARYPSIELLTGILLLLVYLETGLTIDFVFLAVLTATLVVMTFIDVDHQIIPDGLVIFLFGVGFLNKVSSLVLNQPAYWLNSIWGLLLGGGFFLLIAVVSNGGMGGGDIKLMAALGFWFGWQGILMVMFLAFIIGGVAAVGFLIARKKGRKEMLPFGPFIALGTYLTALYGSGLWEWYTNLFM
ncbi:MAG: A24 family peptidase [Bacillota bacterium]|nr:A24 family peptidase [Bacillota bacterium]MDW7678556.1 A24 family peptidase [Bacillota bacterium]